MTRRIPTVEETLAYLSRFNFFERYAYGAREGEAYLTTHARRFVETLRQLPPLPSNPRILELGAVPYSMTILLQKYAGADVTPLSFYEVDVQESRHVLESPDRSERYEFLYSAVNVERDIFPLEDASFDLVLCCEILEHLLINPSHMLFEAHRVLVPDGFLLISTPNVTRAENVRALHEGRNINDAYHGNGVYGRHNREFAPAEISLLLEACGYTVFRNLTVDVYESTPPGSDAGREDTIFAIGQASRPRRVATPPELYVLMDEYLNVIRPSITMGVDDVGHLGRGWHDLEFEGDRGFRWMGNTATVHVKAQRPHALAFHGQVHHPDVASRPVTISLSKDGKPVGSRQVRDHRWQDIVFDLPERYEGPTSFELSVDRGWTPGGTDQRNLALRIHRVESR